jgi:hypothetical protein
MAVKIIKYIRMKTNQLVCSKRHRAQTNLKLILLSNILFVCISIISFQIWLIAIFHEFKYWLHPNFSQNNLAAFMNNPTNENKVKYMTFECKSVFGTLFLNRSMQWNPKKKRVSGRVQVDPTRPELDPTNPKYFG